MKADEHAPTIVWFRDDLRMGDNPALTHAAASGAPILCIYVYDDSPPLRAPGGASRWWLHHSLAALDKSLKKAGAELFLLKGKARDLVPALARALKAGAVWNRRYDAGGIETDSAIKAQLKEDGLAAESFNAALLYEPWTLRTGAGQPFRVFTPFWKAAQASGAPPVPLPAPTKLAAANWPKDAPKPIALDDLGLLPTKPDWAGGLRETWTPGEEGARARLADFLDNGLKLYGGHRDRPDMESVSRLAPHLRFGEVSPRTAYHAATAAAEAGKASERDAAKFNSELGWREFSYHLLFHNPDLARKNFQPKFDAFQWSDPDPNMLDAWKRGLTGYPIVDAGMRELWRTGFMHNRVRMIVASFLVKDMLVDWRIGEDWFFDTLCDADLANNAASWQWVAGTGADAAPYFRVFNPVLQGEKFDPDGVYVKRFCPELAALPAAYVHKPWLASPAILAHAKVKLGATYPRPILDHAAARDRALAAYGQVKG